MCLIVFCNAVFSQSTSKICTLIRFTLFSNAKGTYYNGYEVLLPYRFTLFSNTVPSVLVSMSVLLPYRFTLFSNPQIYLIVNTFVLLPYRFTLFSNYKWQSRQNVKFYYLIDLHYSQTLPFSVPVVL